MKKMTMLLLLLLSVVLTGCRRTDLQEAAAAYLDASLSTEASSSASVPISPLTPVPTYTPLPAQNCQHARTAWQWGRRSCEPVDGEKHLLLQQEDLVCGSCCKVVRSGTLRMEEPHSFNAQGECDKCGMWRPVCTSTPAPTGVPPYTPAPRR